MIEQKDKDLKNLLEGLENKLQYERSISQHWIIEYRNKSEDLYRLERKCDVEHVGWGHALGMTLVVAATLFFIGLVAGYGVRRVSDYAPEPVKQPWQVHLEKLKHENLVNILV